MIAYTPFLHPLDLHDLWWLTVAPLAFFISVAYKAMRVPDSDAWWRHYWRQVALMTAQTVAGMILLAAVVFLIVEVVVGRFF